LTPEPEEEVPEGQWMARRRQWLAGLGEDRGRGVS
jgi:hypothetical protein